MKGEGDMKYKLTLAERKRLRIRLQHLGREDLIDEQERNFCSPYRFRVQRLQEKSKIK